ncbi:enoyl-CoA hydratase/isomerase family protein [Bordetella sp. BOR01]|uniref:enoyl-CoA hydratase/isomerase family protein n=1 Tax=Bordetella sp. BOR01 TaxID=2854779 RepID=UPI001C43F4AE|nr:enoyl-CoA hydratase-related protein [Bordetella sp. BOR01]MBV7483455.1 enoyl-CoA hydratase/isomerase family protein [Bordetella sp. BOR01]
MSIKVERGAGGIVTVWMDRPQKRNAFTLEMYGEFGTALRALDDDLEVRCIVLRGAGGAFCAGSDIGGFDDGREDRERARGYADFTLSMTDCLRDSIHPTVACIEGPCVGGGLEIATLCDFRICGASSRFGVPANRLGLTLDYRELADLIGAIGSGPTLEILLEGRLFNAKDALAKGVVTEVVEDADVARRAFEVAASIASGAPLVNRWHKKFVRRLKDAHPLTPEDVDESYSCFDTQDYATGRKAFMNKMKPTFSGQ